MRFLKNPRTNPYMNLALDEYAMKHIDVGEDYFFIWQNEPSVIIGKNQNAVQEVNQAFIDENNIHVARRVSGGGAVYHDFGNLNFTFIIGVDDPGKVNYKKYVQPIIDALKSMGVHAEASGRNDILIDGLKISGNAQRMAAGKLMHHGTLIYDVNLEHMVEALNVDPDKIISKGVKSVRSRVTTIKEHLPKGTTIEDFWNELHYYLSNKGQDKEIMLSQKDLDKIKHEADTRFSTWEWNYGYSPEFNLKNSKRFSGGRIEVLMDVNEGLIESIRFMGDYLGLRDVSEVEEKLVGVRFKVSDVEKVLSEINLKLYFGGINLDEIISVIFH
ncbi:MAG TPA: lipoate--protein ligase [Erysipelothrix sp.]|nr:lipoate--protein ligase [Erysipelothrix sp.]